MIIQEKLGQAFGICACEGIGADGTVFSACSRASCSLCTAWSEVLLTPATNKVQDKTRSSAGKRRKNALRNFVLRLSKSSMRSPPYIAKSERIPRSGIMTDKRTSPTRRDSRITMVGSTMETACEIRSMDLSVYCRESLRKVSSLEPE